MKEVNLRKRKARKDVNDDKIKAAVKQKSSGVVSSGSCIFTFILFIVTLLIYDVILVAQDTVDVQAVKTDLLNNVYNQTEAVSIIIDSLNRLYNNEQHVQIVNFIGSTGVGKTFIANVLKRHFHPSVYELNGFFDNIQKNVLHKIKRASSSYPNLIVIDDLTVTDIDKLLNFLKEIPQEVMALVVCIFNIQETDNDLHHSISYAHSDKIIKKFNKAEILHKVAKFHEFDRNQASDWVIKQLILRGVDPQLHSDIVESVLLDQNVRYHGLKGLSSKINLEL
ncbi:hypothetical protein BDFB_001869 [Asbolus verrucosus]|uniref:Uncharacterized protein n=1 Tax=Asbolus verrucosus TaxID=1661398 RepID=A0A482VKC9_ASBVE|nr:hypothetical protein BDFB_001869 [Asbolus verrucosus]